MLLQSHKQFNEVAEFNPETGLFRQLRKDRDIAGSIVVPTGVYDLIGGKRAVLFRNQNTLCLQVENHRLDFNEVTLKLRTINTRRILEIAYKGEPILDLDYEMPILDPPLSDDPTGFVEDEDFDFGLFLVNISADKARQERLFVTQRQS